MLNSQMFAVTFILHDPTPSKGKETHEDDGDEGVRGGACVGHRELGVTVSTWESSGKTPFYPN